VNRLYDVAMSKPLHVRVTPAQAQKLRDLAQAKGMDKSALIREAVDAYLEDEDDRAVFAR
jgi:predicted DNA-binding protein